MISEIEHIVEEACARETNIFGYGIWTHHITLVAQNAKRLARLFNADKDQALYGDHHLHGPLETEKLLQQLGYPPAKIEAVKHCIASHRGSVPVKRNSAEAECLANADAVTHIE